MNQTLLDSNGKMILDATCSFFRIYPKFATIRIDIRPETKPDIVMDAKKLQFPDNYFDEIYCDPPHIIRTSNDLTQLKLKTRLRGRALSLPMLERYWFWKSEKDWFEFVDETNKEFFRCLKLDGKLFYKMTEGSGCVTIDSLTERMKNFKLVEDKIKQSGTATQFNSKAKTHYLCFLPITLATRGIDKIG